MPQRLPRLRNPSEFDPYEMQGWVSAMARTIFGRIVEKQVKLKTVKETGKTPEIVFDFIISA